MRRRKDTGNLMIDFRYNGQRYTETLPEGISERDAKQVEAQRKADVYRQVLGLTTPDTDFREFVASVFLPYSEAHKKSFATDVFACKVLVKYFKGKGLRQITPQAVEQFKQWYLAQPIIYGPEGDKKEKPRKPASVNNYFRILSKILSMAVNQDLILVNPCRKVKQLPVNNNRTRILSEAEEKRLLENLTGQMRDIVIFALNTGMRRGEIYNLKWADVDFERRMITLQDTKSLRKRVVPMNPTVVSMLEGLKKDELVFPSPVTGGVRIGLKRAFQTALKNAKIEDFKFHDLRHTAATRMADRGVGIHSLQQVLGHADIKTTSRYTHATDRGLREAVATLG